jgi:hypothetical protein
MSKMFLPLILLLLREYYSEYLQKTDITNKNAEIESNYVMLLNSLKIKGSNIKFTQNRNSKVKIVGDFRLLVLGAQHASNYLLSLRFYKC